jgi:hypothetical protein
LDGTALKSNVGKEFQKTEQHIKRIPFIEMMDINKEIIIELGQHDVFQRSTGKVQSLPPSVF